MKKDNRELEVSDKEVSDNEKEGVRKVFLFSFVRCGGTEIIHYKRTAYLKLIINDMPNIYTFICEFINKTCNDTQ